MGGGCFESAAVWKTTEFFVCKMEWLPLYRVLCYRLTRLCVCVCLCVCVHLSLHS
jgi:hypothetical protein